MLFERTWQCPWCGAEIRRFATRPLHADPTWHRFSLLVNLCPACRQPVRFARPALAWAVLAAPWIFAVAAALVDELGDGALILCGTAGVLCYWAFELMARLEKSALIPAPDDSAANPPRRALGVLASLAHLAAFGWGLLALVFVLIGAAMRTGGPMQPSEDEALDMLFAGFVAGLPAWLLVAAISSARRASNSRAALVIQNLPFVIAATLFALGVARWLALPG